MLVAAPSALASSAPTTPIPASLFGMHYQGNYPTVSFGLIAKGSGVIWPYIQPTSNASYNWSTLDGYVSAAQSHNLPLIYTFEYIPGWAVSNQTGCGTLYNGTTFCPKKPDNMQNLSNFMSAFLARYCPAGVPKIQYFELYNEPYDVYTSANYQLPPADLAKMTDVMYKAIKTSCPAMKIISPSWGPYNGNGNTASTWISSYAQAYYTALGPVGTDPVDITSVHMYSNEAGGSTLTPESLMPGGGLNDPTMNSIISTYASGKPIWDTEGSWGQNTLSTDQEVGFIARWYLLHWSNGYSSMEWYQWENSTYGTLYGNPTAQTAYTQTYNWMVGATMTVPCAASGSVYTCTLTRPNNYKALAVWNISGSSLFNVPSGYTQYRDLGGSTTQLGGVKSVTIGTKPILLESLATVSTPAPSVSLLTSNGTNNTMITAGQSTTLSWSSTNATNCTSQNQDFSTGGAASNLTGVVVTPSATTQYSITCTGAGGLASKSVTVTVTTPQVSPSGTTIPSTPSITDTTGTTWTLVGGQIARNGVIDTTTSDVILLLYYNGVVYQEISYVSSSGQRAIAWYSWMNGAWALSADPRPATLAPTATPAPVTNIPFAKGARVMTTANLNVRGKPNIKSGIINCTQPVGALGTVAGGPSDSQGYTWWLIDFDSMRPKCDGWSVQDYLTTNLTQTTTASSGTVGETPSGTSQVAASSEALSTLANIKIELLDLLAQISLLQQKLGQ